MSDPVLISLIAAVPAALAAWLSYLAKAEAAAAKTKAEDAALAVIALQHNLKTFVDGIDHGSGGKRRVDP